MIEWRFVEPKDRGTVYAHYQATVGPALDDFLARCTAMGWGPDVFARGIVTGLRHQAIPPREDA